MKNEVNVELNKEKASWLKVVVIDFLVALAIVMAANFLIELDYVDGTSMNPTLQNGNIYVSTLTDFADSEKGFHTLSLILHNAGIPFRVQKMNLTGEGVDHDPNNLLLDPSVDTSKKTTK